MAPVNDPFLLLRDYYSKLLNNPFIAKGLFFLIEALERS